MSDTFKPGDTVMLKSGGAPMTVLVHVTGEMAINEGYPEYVTCDWLDASGNHARQKFHPGQLEAAVKLVSFNGNKADVAWSPESTVKVEQDIIRNHAKEPPYRVVPKGWLK